MADVPWTLPTEIKSERNKFDPFSRSVSMITERHRLIHEGLFYYCVANELAIANNSFRYILLRTGNIPPHFNAIEITATEGPFNVSLFEGASVDLTGSPSAGTLVEGFNANRLSSNVAGLQAYSLGDTAPSPLGAMFLGNLFVPFDGRNGITGSSKVEELILLPNSDYIMSLHNDVQGGGSADAHIFFSFYELDWSKAFSTTG
jgi:hypothetical protein